MGKVKKIKAKKKKPSQRKAVSFSIKRLANETVKAAKKDKESGIKAINNAMRLIGSFLRNQGEFNQAKNAFNRYKRIVNKAKIGISIEDSAFVSLVKVTNPLMYAEKYIKPTNDDNDNNDTAGPQ